MTYFTAIFSLCQPPCRFSFSRKERGKIPSILFFSDLHKKSNRLFLHFMKSFFLFRKTSVFHKEPYRTGGAYSISDGISRPKLSKGVLNPCNIQENIPAEVSLGRCLIQSAADLPSAALWRKSPPAMTAVILSKWQMRKSFVSATQTVTSAIIITASGATVISVSPWHTFIRRNFGIFTTPRRLFATERSFVSWICPSTVPEKELDPTRKRKVTT